MKITVGLLSLLVCISCFAETVYWTGRRDYVTTVTGKQAAKCYYSISLFDKRSILLVAKDGEMFPPPCPEKIEVE